MRFIATSAGVEEDLDDDFRDVWISENSDRSGRSLSFQCALREPDEDEAEMGIDSYCVSTNGATVYGPVREVRLENSTLHFSIVPEDAQILHIDETIEVELGIPEDEVPIILASLRSVLTWGRAESVPALIGF